MDVMAAALIGAGAGGVMLGSPIAGIAAVCWGAFRTARRHVVRSIDEGTEERLLRLLPSFVTGSQRLSILHHLRREVHAWRGITSGDTRYVDLTHIDYGHQQMSRGLDYT